MTIKDLDSFIFTAPTDDVCNSVEIVVFETDYEAQNWMNCLYGNESEKDFYVMLRFSSDLAAKGFLNEKYLNMNISRIYAPKANLIVAVVREL